jgi:hypothetical protein
MTLNLSADASQALSSLEKKWPDLRNDVDRATALEPVHRKGVPYRLLAENLGCSASRVRYLCQAARAPVPDRLQAGRGKISTRELVRRSKEAEKLASAKELDVLDQQRTKEATKGAEMIGDWLKTKLGFAGIREKVIDEARRILAENKWSGTLPNCAPPSGTTVETIIERTRPPRSVNPDSDSIGWVADWLARWVFFAFPNEVVRDRALNIALDKEIKTV